MVASHQDIADIAVLKASAEDPAIGDFNLDGSVGVGLSLATMRKAKGLTHADIHAGTKIRPEHIAAIEAGDLDALPATPFTAGFVKAYAQFLGLDADRFARAYKEETGFVPLAAPALTAIMREAAKTRAAGSRGEESPLPAASSASAPALAPAPPPFSAPQSAAWSPSALVRGIEADKLVTWLGAGAAIAVAAFLAGRAVQPQKATSEIAAPPPTVIAEAPTPTPEPVVLAPAPAPAAIKLAPPAAEVRPIVIEPAPTAVAAVKPPMVKPQPKNKTAEEVPPAPVEATPVPVLYTTPAVEDPPLADLVAEPPAPVAAVEEPPAAPQPEIIPARMIRGATPEYPDRCAGRAGEMVAVKVIFSITPEGKPVSASVVSSSDRCFNPAAQRAVYDMRFSPRTVDGVPALETGKTVTIQFVR